jgi:hypothetical protein
MQMNRTTKVGLVSAIFVITGLFGSLSYAAPEVNNDTIYSVIVKQNIAMNNNPNNIAHNYAFSRITNKTFAEFKKANLPSFSSASRQPLQGIQVIDFAHIVPNTLQKKNTIFEFAAKFNDKLQQILAIFDFSSSKKMTNKDNIKQSGKVLLSKNIDTCSNNKK